MNGSGFWRNVGIGLLASLVGTVAFHVFAPWLSDDLVRRGADAAERWLAENPL